MANQYAICLQNELEVFWKKLKHLKQVSPSNSWLISAYPEQIEALLARNTNELLGYLLR